MVAELHLPNQALWLVLLREPMLLHRSSSTLLATSRTGVMASRRMLVEKGRRRAVEVCNFLLCSFSCRALPMCDFAFLQRTLFPTALF